MYNALTYIKSFAHINILCYSSFDTTLNPKFTYYNKYNKYKKLANLRNAINIYQYLLIPIPVKINNKNIFLLLSVNDMYGNIVFMKNHVMEYSYYHIRNEYNNNINNYIDKIILNTYRNGKIIIASKLALELIKN